jgi:ribosome-associated translation inhibitor RaiA
MRIAIRAEGVSLPRALLESIKSRVSIALARFGEHIGQVTTRFWVPAAATPSEQKYCQIEVELRLPKIIRAETMDTDPLVAVNRAANRLARTIIREVTMSRSPPVSAATHADHAPKAKKTSTRQSKARRGEPDGIDGTGSRKNRKTTSTTRRKS